MGSIHKSQVGFTQLLSSGNVIPGVSSHASTTGHPLHGRGLGRGREASAGYGLHADSTNARCEQIFSLTAMWAHPHQAHLHTLEEVAHKLLLLVDNGPDWPYAFVQMNDTMSHAPLSRDGHISAITDGTLSMNACGQLHQVQVQKLL